VRVAPGSHGSGLLDDAKGRHITRLDGPDRCRTSASRRERRHGRRLRPLGRLSPGTYDGPPAAHAAGGPSPFRGCSPDVLPRTRRRWPQRRTQQPRGPGRPTAYAAQEATTQDAPARRARASYRARGAGGRDAGRTSPTCSCVLPRTRRRWPQRRTQQPASPDVLPRTRRRWPQRRTQQPRGPGRPTAHAAQVAATQDATARQPGRPTAHAAQVATTQDATAPPARTSYRARGAGGHNAGRNSPAVVRLLPSLP
jgi:hypothetical protein